MRIAVFCGSKLGQQSVYRVAAERCGRALAERGVGLVFGGGHIGLMGVVADAAIAAGGETIGVIPQSMVESELAHPGLTRLEVVATMHQRKALMAELADAFLALPGGYGTLDELFEILTWAQLRLHAKPIGLCNVAGYFDPLLAWVQKALDEGFLAGKHRRLLRTAADPADLIDLLLTG
jgi:uncharacterized protein (TIGR00730 family)